MEELIKDASSHFPELEELVTRMIAIGMETWVGQDVVVDLPYPPAALVKVKNHIAFAGWTCTVVKGPSYVLWFDAIRSCYPRRFDGESSSDLRLRLLGLDIVSHFIGMVKREVQKFEDPKVRKVTMDVEGRRWHLEVVKKQGRKASLVEGKVVISSAFTGAYYYHGDQTIEEIWEERAQESQDYFEEYGGWY
jgi:hypothetical protein